MHDIKGLSYETQPRRCRPGRITLRRRRRAASAAGAATPEPANIPMAPVAVAPAPKPARQPKAAPAATVGITLRPGARLLNRYTLAAADRTREEGRVISAQQIMLEVLERHAPKVGQ